MRRSPLSYVLIAAAIVGLILLGLAAGASFGQIHVRARNYKGIYPPTRTYNCGSVLRPNDPRNLVGRTAAVPGPLRVADRLCEAKRTSRSHRATTLLVIGAVLIVAALVIPALMRRARRRKHRPRRTYSV